MILQDQSQKFRERMLETQQAREEAKQKEDIGIKLATTEGVSEMPTEPYATPPSGNVFTAGGKQYSYTSQNKLPRGYYKAGDTLFKDIGGGNLQPVKTENEKAPQHHFVTDDKGEVTQITNFSDGRIAKVPLGRLGTTKSDKEGKEPSWQAKTDYTIKNGKVWAQNFDFNPKTRQREPVGAPYEAPRSVTEDIFDKLKKLSGEGEGPSFQGPGVYRDADGKEVKINSESEWKTLIGSK